ncbi:MAG: hypothetical protein Q9M94_02555, partial [Candidatus Gracilibacteria bacterium]|nr:hypothetical protein [Candidatus Gracilibacteria bacterium]
DFKVIGNKITFTQIAGKYMFGIEQSTQGDTTKRDTLSIYNINGGKIYKVLDYNVNLLSDSYSRNGFLEGMSSFTYNSTGIGVSALIYGEIASVGYSNYKAVEYDPATFKFKSIKDNTGYNFSIVGKSGPYNLIHNPNAIGGINLVGIHISDGVTLYNFHNNVLYKVLSHKGKTYNTLMASAKFGFFDDKFDTTQSGFMSFDFGTTDLLNGYNNPIILSKLDAPKERVISYRWGNTNTYNASLSYTANYNCSIMNYKTIGLSNGYTTFGDSNLYLTNYGDYTSLLNIEKKSIRSISVYHLRNTTQTIKVNERCISEINKIIYYKFVDGKIEANNKKVFNGDNYYEVPNKSIFIDKLFNFSVDNTVSYEYINSESNNILGSNTYSSLINKSDLIGEKLYIKMNNSLDGFNENYILTTLNLTEKGYYAGINQGQHGN